MRISLGLYTEISSSSPVPAFSRALSLVYKPVFSHMYNNPGLRLSLYQSVAMMKYLASSCREVNMLISSLAKRDDIELVTGTYSQAILSLNPPKDRSLQVERMTTLIRRYYGVKASSAFFYGQIWAPSFIHSLRNSGIGSVVISAYKATGREKVAASSFVMNEIGKKVAVRVISDEAAQLVSRYAQGEIGFSDFRSALFTLVSSAPDGSIFFLNIDQLLEGAARNSHDDALLPGLIIDLLSSFQESLSLLSDIPSETPGYLDSGWYGRDAYAYGLHSFNDLFVRSCSFRYLLNRYLMVAETAAQFKKDKAVRKAVESELFHLSIGPLFIHDAQCTPMRLTERRAFWKAIIEGEKRIYDADPLALRAEYDLEESGMNDCIARNKAFTAVFSPLGGAVTELCYNPLSVNVLDTRTPFDKAFPNTVMLRSFSDEFLINGVRHDLSQSPFTSETLSRTRGEYLFTRSGGNMTLSKHFKLRSQTLVMETTVRAAETLYGDYTVNVYVSLFDMILASSDQRRQMILGRLDDAKTVRYTETQTGLNLSFSSTEPFSVSEERVRQNQNTSIGIESFELYTRLSFSFPLSLPAGDERTYRFILRVSDSRKDRE